MYNSLVERCFRDCVSEFRSKDLNAGEEKVRLRIQCLVLGSKDPRASQKDSGGGGRRRRVWPLGQNAVANI